jgi:type II secretory pathway pseudopilin PulG
MSSRWRAEAGFTLSELLIACSLMIVVLAATLTVFDQFVQTSSRNTRQNDAQDSARFTIDQLARQLRNLALPTPQSPNSIDLASGYDLVFKTADPGRRRVRYCLQTSAPYSASNGALWVQTQTGSVGGADPAVPSTASCPVEPASGGWATKRLVAAHVTNRNGADRPLFQFNADPATPSKITGVHTAVYLDVDPSQAPSETRISTGVFLRNQNQAPAAAFTISPGGATSRHIVMNAANSTDPEGRTLAYFWFLGSSPSFTNAVSSGACNTADGCIASGILNDYTVPTGVTASQIFTLLVKDPGGLTATSSSTCSQSGGSWTCTTPG